MDANKLAKLKEIKYKIRSSCALCIHALLEPDGWGVCTLNTYNHEKHTDSERRLSINQYGSCNNWKFNPNEEYKLGGFRQFLDE